MAGESFQELLKLGDSSKRTSIDSVSLNQDIEEAKAIQRHQADVEAQRANERVINKKVAADLAKTKELKATFGTADPRKIAAITAAGGFEAGDIAKQMSIDPEGTKASVEKRIMMAGHGGVQDAPDMPAREFRRGVGRGGEAYYTNLSDAELAEGQRSEAMGQHPLDIEDKGPRVTGLQAFEPGGTSGVSSGSEGVVPNKSVEDILFEGKVDQARTITEKPERDEKHEVAKNKYFDKIWAKNEDIHSVRENLMDDLESGAARAAGMTIKDIKDIDAIVLKRGKGHGQMTGLDPTMFKPWVKAQKRPGEGEDISEPASVLNPGGGSTQTTKAKISEAQAANQAAMDIEETMPAERTTAYQYAKGKVAKKAGTKQVARGGKGGDILSDLAGFRAGEGRAGYGESGPAGMAKDLAAFYGPRLITDIPAAVLTAETGGRAAGLGKKLTGLRAIENMLGKF